MTLELYVSKMILRIVITHRRSILSLNYFTEWCSDPMLMNISILPSWRHTRSCNVMRPRSGSILSKRTIMSLIMYILTSIGLGEWICTTMLHIHVIHLTSYNFYCSQICIQVQLLIEIIRHRSVGCHCLRLPLIPNLIFFWWAYLIEENLLFGFLISIICLAKRGLRYMVICWFSSFICSALRVIRTSGEQECWRFVWEALPISAD
jgi:hypothetical protein